MVHITGFKRAQIVGQIFIYIMAVIIVGAIALIGYNAVKGIMQKSCDAQKVSFKSDIEGLIETYTSYGSVNKKILPAPCNYDTVCFIDASSIGSPLSKCINSIINNSASLNVLTDVFIVSGKQTIGIDYSPLISLPDSKNCTCIDQRNGNFYITFSGQGSSAQISSG